MILTLVAMLSMTTAFAEGEMAMGTSNMEAYELNINMDKLSEALNLADDQKEAGEVDALRAEREAVPYLSHIAEFYD